MLFAVSSFSLSFLFLFFVFAFLHFFLVLTHLSLHFVSVLFLIPSPPELNPKPLTLHPISDGFHFFLRRKEEQSVPQKREMVTQQTTKTRTRACHYRGSCPSNSAKDGGSPPVQHQVAHLSEGSTREEAKSEGTRRRQHPRPAPFPHERNWETACEKEPLGL